MEYGLVEDNSEEATRREGLEPGTLNIRAELGHWDFSCSIH